MKMTVQNRRASESRFIIESSGQLSPARCRFIAPQTQSPCKNKNYQTNPFRISTICLQIRAFIAIQHRAAAKNEPIFERETQNELVSVQIIRIKANQPQKFSAFGKINP